MKKTIVLFVAAALATVSMAGPDKPVKTPKTISCAVMPADKVDVAEATKAHRYTDYKGRRYFFCCPACPAAFQKDPAKYAKHASIPTPAKAH